MSTSTSRLSSTRLFPGGTGRLSLTDPEDLLDTGVDVEVRPAGRNVRRLSLLSGGERSLVALAFLFAVFRSRPSPFYLMDEVEAALDDVNLQRFLGLVHEFRGEAQLIIVSHQKRTMEAADALYGVTMAPGGSSKVVSQKVPRGHVGPDGRDGDLVAIDPGREGDSDEDARGDDHDGVDGAESRGDDQTAHLAPEGASWTMADPLPDFDLVDAPDVAEDPAPADGADQAETGGAPATGVDHPGESELRRGPVPVPDSGFSAEFIAELTSEEGTPTEGEAAPTDGDPTDDRRRDPTARKAPLAPSDVEGATVAPSDELGLEDALGEEPSTGGSGEDGTGTSRREPGIGPTGWKPRVVRPERVGGSES